MKALLVIDVQLDYFKGGASELVQPEAALANVKKLLSFFTARQWPVYLARHIGTAADGFFKPDTRGCELHPDLQALADSCSIIVKHYPNCFYQTTLAPELKRSEVTDLVICGMMTHMCVDSTVRQAYDLGYEVKLISDGCATKNLTWQTAELPAALVNKVIFSAVDGAFAQVLSTDAYLKTIQ